MAVFRIEKTRDYTVMSNHHLRDTDLSLKSKGLLSMMLSLPEDWNYTTRGLAKICKEGTDSIWYEAEPEERNFITLLDLINASEAREDDEEFQSPVDLLFAKLEKEHPDHFAVKQYRKFKMAAGDVWRQAWQDTANRYLEAIGSPERLNLKSYERQGIGKIPTVHMGPAVSYLERNGIQTNIGNLNRDIKAANSLMQSIRQMVRSLKGWLSGLKEKKASLLEALEQAKEPTIPELLSRYLDMRSEERTGWTSKGKLKGTVGDFNKVMEALDFLRRKEISTVESLDAYLDLLIDEETAPIVRRLFAWALEGHGPNYIRRRLEEEKIPCPTYWNRVRGFRNVSTKWEKKDPVNGRYKECDFINQTEERR